MGPVAVGVFLLFVDGIGLGRRDPAVNPFVRARMPVLAELLGGPMLAETLPLHGPRVWAGAADATLGIPGLPQSATGQTTILTGINAARAIGRHLNAYPTPSLRAILAEHSLFKQVRDRGRRVAFLNAYRPEFFVWLAATGGAPGRESEFGVGPFSGPFTPPDAGQDADQPPPQAEADDAGVEGAGPPAATTRALLPMMQRRGIRRYRPSASTVAVLAAGMVPRNVNDLAAGQAVYHDITHWTLQRMGVPVAPVPAGEAGRRAARVAAEHDFTMYEHFLTDLAGHGQDMDHAILVLETLDEFLGGVVESLAPETTLLIISDHGNLENLGSKSHTTNPVPVIALGPAAPHLVRSIVDLTAVVPATLAVLDGNGDPAGP